MRVPIPIRPGGSRRAEFDVSCEPMCKSPAICQRDAVELDIPRYRDTSVVAS